MMTRTIMLAALLAWPSVAAAQRLPAEPQASVSTLQPFRGAGVDSTTATQGHAVTGLLIGAGVGLVAAYLLFAPGSNACSGSGDYEENCRWYRAGIVVGSAGLGAFIGSQIRTKKSG